jgi:hypothetical protein
MYRKFMALLLGLAAALGIALVAPAGAANASDCDLNGTVCGRIRNWDATGDALWVTIAWGQNGSGRTLYAGQQSWDHWADTDGFYIGPCWRAHLWKQENGEWYDYGYQYEGWHKVTNNIWPPSINYWQVDGIVKIC